MSLMYAVTTSHGPWCLSAGDRQWVTELVDMQRLTEQMLRITLCDTESGDTGGFR